ncbi:hypothetical protein D5F01_LYC01472 [Larimichthys crocea]|uniref:Uncharacterized protein n=1 Tax=Larimichthys crocea TaxID=215358 RepID=A0A6G0J6B2_LARCR|nr:hypothetical protein D5F01_LYC01472 [Larimichthys crocea]
MTPLRSDDAQVWCGTKGKALADACHSGNHPPFCTPGVGYRDGPQDCHTKTRQERPRSSPFKGRSDQSQPRQSAASLAPPSIPTWLSYTRESLRGNVQDRPRLSVASPNAPREGGRVQQCRSITSPTSKTPMLKSKMPPTEQKGNGTAEASAFPVHSREGVTRASRDRALPPWPLQASRLG